MPHTPPVTVTFKFLVAHASPTPHHRWGRGGQSGWCILVTSFPFSLGFHPGLSHFTFLTFPRSPTLFSLWWVPLSRLHRSGMTQALTRRATWASWGGIAERHPWLAESPGSCSRKRRVSEVPVLLGWQTPLPHWASGLGLPSRTLVYLRTRTLPATLRCEEQLWLSACRAWEGLPQRVIARV